MLELEIGVVGGEEDGVAHEINEKLYTARGRLRGHRRRRSGSGEKGIYLLAATFGNVHGVYKPGNVKLRPEILKQGQDVVAKEFGLSEDKPFNLVFHGGSGSAQSEIREALSYGVVKMNVDTDTQYAFTRPIVGHMFSNYDGVLKVDGEVGNKKAYDPRSYLKAAETGMAARVVQACEDLLSAGQSQRPERMTHSHNLLGEPPATLLPAEPGGRRRAGGGQPAGRGRGAPPDGQRGLGGAGRGGAEPARARRCTRPSRPTPTPAPATTAAWTRCAATAGRASARCRGRTSPTAASCAASPCWRRPPRRSARSTSRSAAPQLLRDCDPTLAP